MTGQRLDRYLSERHPDISRARWQEWIEAGQVRVNGQPVTKPAHRLRAGDKMETRDDFADFVEKAETGAIGRALAMCGYGTQFAPELSEGDLESGRIAYADSPQPIRGEGVGRAAEPTPEAMLCADCGRALRKPQYDLSMAKFHRPLCPACQRHAQPAAPSAP
jgi:hypothetical protein